MAVAMDSALLTAGIRKDFTTTYSSVRQRVMSSQLPLIMQMGVPATTRSHTFGYLKSSPLMQHWPMGQSVPEDGMGSESWTVPIYNWAARVKWHKYDRADDQTGTLFQEASATGQSAALLPDLFAQDAFAVASGGSTATLPAVPNAPDGAGLYSATDGNSVDRFGVSGGNIVSGSGVASPSSVLQDYYNTVVRAKRFQDTKGQPLLSPNISDGTVVIVHSVENTKVMEEAFLQTRQAALGPDNTSDPVTSATVSNIVRESSRNVQLWGTPRVSGNDWFVFFTGCPVKPMFELVRQEPIELTALQGDNNSDSVRNTGMEYVQWECRKSLGINLPFGTIMVNN